MIVYIAGPISHQPNGNREAFAAAQVYFEAQGHTVLNPHVICSILEKADDWDALSEDQKWSMCMKLCLSRLVFADQVFALDGWNESRGALREVTVAEWLGIHVRYQS